MDEEQQTQAQDPELWASNANSDTSSYGGDFSSAGGASDQIPPTTAENAAPRAELMSQYADGKNPAPSDGYKGAPDKPLEDSWGNSLIGGAGSRLVSGLGIAGRFVAGQIARLIGKK